MKTESPLVPAKRNTKTPHSPPSLFKEATALAPENMPASLGWTISLVALIGFLLYVLKPYLITLMAGVTLATALLPVYRRLAKKIHSPKFRAFLLVMGFSFACVLPGAGALLAGVSQLQESQNQGEILKAVSFTEAKLSPRVDAWLQEHPTWDHWLLKTNISRGAIIQKATRLIDKGRAGLLEEMENWVKGLPAAVISGIVLLITMFYVFLDHARVVNWFSRLPAFHRGDIQKIGKTFSDTCVSVLFASVISGLTQASIFFLTSWAIHFGRPLVFGLFAFFCSFIPLVGTGLVTTGGVLLALIYGDWRAAVGLLIGGCIAGVSDNLIAPIVVGNRAKVHPLLTFVGALAGVEMLGPWGLLIGPVVTASVLRSLTVATTGEGGKIIQSRYNH